MNALENWKKLKWEKFPFEVNRVFISWRVACRGINNSLLRIPGRLLTMMTMHTVTRSEISHLFTRTNKHPTIYVVRCPIFQGTSQQVRQGVYVPFRSIASEIECLVSLHWAVRHILKSDTIHNFHYLALVNPRYPGNSLLVSRLSRNT